MTTVSLKSLANKYEAFDGQVTFYLMGYRTLQADLCVNRLERITPQFEYVNEHTGERVHAEPESHRLALETEAKTGVPTPSEWTINRLWESQHDAFWLCDPLTVEIEFNLRADSPAAAKALQNYWQNRNGSMENNWMLFNQVLSMPALNVWIKAHNATRDDDMSAPPELQTGEPDKALDPNAGGGGKKRRTN